MIATWLGFVIALVWLLQETKWLTVRLPVGIVCKTGECCPWRMPDDAVDDKMINELLERWDNIPHPDRNHKLLIARLSGYQSQPVMYHGTSKPTPPLCGWGYAYQARNFNPPLEFSFGYPGYQQHCQIYNGDYKLVQDVMKVHHKVFKEVNL